MDTPRDRTDAFAARLVASVPMLRAYVRLNTSAALRQFESTSDIVQSMCKDLLKAGPPLDAEDPARFHAWLATVALNKLRDRERYWLQQKRDRRRLTPLADDDGSHAPDLRARTATPSQNAVAHELGAQFERALGAMSPEDRELVKLQRIDGQSAAEIGARFGMSPELVRTRVRRALFAFTERRKRAERRDDRAD